MDGAPALLYCPKPCCRLLFSGFYPQQFYPQHIGIHVDHCHYNSNTHNVAFCIFSFRTLNNLYKLLAIIVTCNEKQTN